MKLVLHKTLPLYYRTQLWLALIVRKFKKYNYEQGSI
jgi:hypothetical protein